MKKVIFISALALAAAVSCNKSEIVDTKFNEQISFETYTGRDAMTKATPYGSSNVPTEIGLYGYYLGNNPTWGTASKANLWQNATLTETTTAGVWAVAEDPKYWANDADNYTFLAYAPIATTTEGDYYVAEGTDGENPEINYTVDSDLSKQIDLLYAKAEGTAAGFKTSGVTLNMKHALARLTVTAMAPEDPNGFQFDVKEVTISGKFNTTGNLYLATAAAGDENTADAGWGATASATDVVYSFYDNYDPSYDATTTKWDVLPTTSETAVNYAFYAMDEESGKYVKGADDAPATNYLMMIPTKFTEANKAILSVTYTTIYENQESQPVTKELPIVMDFRMGKAYAINLNFSHTATPITFNVSVAEWGPDNPVTSTGAGKNNPEDYAAKTETTTPEEGE